MGRVRTFFPKILQGVRFLVDGYVYTGPYSMVFSVLRYGLEVYGTIFDSSTHEEISS